MTSLMFPDLMNSVVLWERTDITNVPRSHELCCSVGGHMTSLMFPDLKPLCPYVRDDKAAC
jgi:hypothetical protein